MAKEPPARDSTAKAPSAKAPPAGMDKQALKKLLVRARSSPVNCAVAEGAGPSAGRGLLLMHRVKQPKAMLAELMKGNPGAKNLRFGAVAVDVEKDPKLVTFYLNRLSPGGLAKKLRKSIRGSGFTKVAISDEDPPAVDRR